MTYSSMFQKIKHQSYIPSKKEMDEIKQFLSLSSAIYDQSSHAAIYIYCKFNGPSKENIELIKRFLSRDTDDYVMSAAISNLTRTWGVFSADVKDFIEETLMGMNLPYQHDSIVNSFSACLLMNDKAHDGSFLDLSHLAFTKALAKRDDDDDFADLFVSLFNAVCVDARKKGVSILMAESVEDAAARSEEILAYLDSRQRSLAAER